MIRYRTFLPVLLLLLSSCAFGQIPTPDFRFYASCPTMWSQVYKCAGWYQPTDGTSDYFNACASPANVGIPKNYFGYQAAAINAYMGLYTLDAWVWDSVGFDYKEYIGTDFPALTVGHTYTMTITVSLADSSTYATDGLGVFFSTYQVQYPAMTTYPATPQVDYSSYGVITDKLNWVTLTKTFVADSAYTHLIVGCFKPLWTLHIDTVRSTTNQERYCYYYIGQIGEPDSTRHLPNDSTTVSIDTIVHTDTNLHVKDTNWYVFPSAFSPNGDGVNEGFGIIVKPGLTLNNYTLSIFNRFGERVFFADEQHKKWNGTYENVDAEVGVYFYFAEFYLNGERRLVKGDLTLVR